MSPADPCHECGLCCKKMIIEIDHIDVVRESRLIPHASLLDDGMIPFESDWDKTYMLCGGGSKDPCPMLDGDNRCSIYATRPNVCIAFEVGSEKCNELRTDAGLEPVAGIFKKEQA